LIRWDGSIQRWLAFLPRFVRPPMRRLAIVSALAIPLLPLLSSCHSASQQAEGPRPAAQQTTTGGMYQVLKRARVGGEGGTDYIHADPVGRRLYITRNAVRAVPATDSTPARPAVLGRVSVFDLETLAPLGE